MRGQGSLSTRALTLWAWLLCVVLTTAGSYSIAHAQRADKPDDQAALAVPRVALRGAPSVGLPQPLAPSEAVRIRRIFALQASGAIAEARRETDRLEDSLLLGAILADRYLASAYRPAPTELTGWLARFGDQPDAPAIQALLERQAPELVAPTTPAPAVDLPAGRGRRVAAPTQAHTLFVQNRDAEAVAAARPLLTAASAGSGAADSLIAAGLSAWRLGEADTASGFFEAAYRVAPTAALRAASAYWMARANRRMNQGGASVVWMRLAAEEGGTFYGIIARRVLGPSLTCASGQTLGIADVDALLAAPEGRRAFALLQVGEKRRAEAEFRALWLDAGQDPALGRPLSLLARAVGLTLLAAEVEPGGGFADRSEEPDTLPSLHPEGGFIVDPALVYALVRQESNFRPAVVSHAGARGLMQIMPNTARAIGGGQMARLHEPAVNLAIGQRYLMALSEDEDVDGDLMRVLAGYGQGVNGLKRWVNGVRDAGEPLLFLEAIPNPQTRVLIEEALAYSWHYATLLHLPATSLDELAAGRYPRLMRAGGGPERSGGLAAACARGSAAR